jgi:hypothetical protein
MLANPAKNLKADRRDGELKMDWTKPHLSNVLSFRLADDLSNDPGKCYGGLIRSGWGHFPYRGCWVST